MGEQKSVSGYRFYFLAGVIFLFAGIIDREKSYLFILGVTFIVLSYGVKVKANKY
jgi:hypothetical protein